jgi:transposase
MKEISIIGVDLAKRFFQIHGVDAEHQVVVQKQLSRSEFLCWFSRQEPCLVGMEACATSQYWARELIKLGYDVRLIPPAYVKPYVRRQKNDRADAAAICEAVSRPAMRFATIKTVDQQAAQVLHRTRELLIKQRTQMINALRAHLAEFGFIFPQGNKGWHEAVELVGDDKVNDLPILVRQVLQTLVDSLKNTQQEIAKLDKQMAVWHRVQTDSTRLATIPGIGVVTASAIVATIGDGKQFKSGREFAAWVGLVPRQNSSGGKERLGGISKKGNMYLRQLLVTGATTQLRGKQRTKAPGGVWFGELLRRKPARVAAVALANKMARVAWAVLTKDAVYQASTVLVDVGSQQDNILEVAA